MATPLLFVRFFLNLIWLFILVSVDFSIHLSLVISVCFKVDLIIHLHLLCVLRFNYSFIVMCVCFKFESLYDIMWLYFCSLSVLIPLFTFLWKTILFWKCFLYWILSFFSWYTICVNCWTCCKFLCILYLITNVLGCNLNFRHNLNIQSKFFISRSFCSTLLIILLRIREWMVRRT